MGQRLSLIQVSENGHTESANKASITVVVYRVRVIMQEGDYRREEEPLELLWINGTTAPVAFVVPVRCHDIIPDSSVILCSPFELADSVEDSLRGADSGSSSICLWYIVACGLFRRVSRFCDDEVGGHPDLHPPDVNDVLKVSSEDTMRGGKCGTLPHRKQVRRLIRLM